MKEGLETVLALFSVGYGQLYDEIDMVENFHWMVSWRVPPYIPSSVLSEVTGCYFRGKEIRSGIFGPQPPST